MQKKAQLSQGAALPSWYWVRGLHDAIIENITFDDTPRFADGKYRSNCLTLSIYAKCALFDTGIKEIRFYNCSGCEELIREKYDSWIHDELIYTDGKYTLMVELRKHLRHRLVQGTVTLRFTDCEVLRES